MFSNGRTRYRMIWPEYVRRYASDCGDAPLADGWERQSYALIRPFLTLGAA